MLPEIEDELEEQELLRFRSDGLIPFVTIIAIRIYRKTSQMIVDAACFVDFRLDEHGISILSKDNQWIFG